MNRTETKVGLFQKSKVNFFFVHFEGLMEALINEILDLDYEILI